MSRRDPWLVLSLGVVEYQEAWDLQRRLAEARQREIIGDVLVLLEHPHTYTLGRRATPEHLLWDEQTLARKGIACFPVDRGGDVTYHGPGQLVGYPIMNIRQRGVDVHGYLRGLEAALMRALAWYSIGAGRDPAYTGVWVSDAKIAAIGVKISRGVTSHGFALNVNTDLAYFQGIVPCGIPHREVTSMERLLERPQDMGHVCETVIEAVVAEFGGDWRSAELSALVLPSQGGGNARPEAVSPSHSPRE